MNKQMMKEIPNWEKEYLNMRERKYHLNNREEEILNGAEIKSHEGMLFGRMYADWKRLKGYDAI